MVKLYTNSYSFFLTCQFSLRLQSFLKMVCNFSDVIPSQKYILFVLISYVIFICIDYIRYVLKSVQNFQ